MQAREYESFDGLGLAALVGAGEVSAGELVETAIGLIDERDPALNAVIHRMFERARAIAAGLDRDAAGRAPARRWPASR